MKHCSITHPKISLEDFIYYYHIAYKRKNIQAMHQLCDTYPELTIKSVQLFSPANKDDPADFDHCYQHPVIVGNTRMTERRVLDMIAYLFSQERAPRKYKQMLRASDLPYRLVFNHALDRYQKDYAPDGLWSQFFLQLPELQERIERRRISSLMELECRAAEYFTDHLSFWNWQI